MKWAAIVGICCLATLANGIYVPEKKADDLAELVHSMEKEVEELRATVKTMQSTKLRRNYALQNFTGFTAFATATRDFDSGNTVTFDGVRENIGNAYNSQTSTFTCQVTGYYYFDLHIYESNNRDFGASIALDSNARTKVYIAADVGDNIKGSTSVVLYCQANQSVTVRCEDEGELEGNANAETTFSGFLVGNV